jgi:hypothetical protein
VPPITYRMESTHLRYTCWELFDRVVVSGRAGQNRCRARCGAGRPLCPEFSSPHPADYAVMDEDLYGALVVAILGFIVCLVALGIHWVRSWGAQGRDAPPTIPPLGFIVSVGVGSRNCRERTARLDPNTKSSLRANLEKPPSQLQPIELSNCEDPAKVLELSPWACLTPAQTSIGSRSSGKRPHNHAFVT